MMVDLLVKKPKSAYKKKVVFSSSGNIGLSHLASF
jgi:hypothetical protein